MAHRIENTDKQQGIIQAWHGLTEIVPGLALDNSWLSSWDIQPVELYKRSGDGCMVKSKYVQLECSDNGMEVGQPYNPETFRPITNAEFINLVKESIAGTGHKVVSIGSVRSRGRTFVSLELAGMEKFKAAGREFSAYLNFGNGHDKSSVLWVNTSNICTVCDNTFGFNLHKVENKQTDSNADISIRQRHTKNATLRFPEFAQLIDKAVGVQAEFALEFTKLAEKPCLASQARQVFAGFVPEPSAKELSTKGRNVVERLTELFQHGKGNRGANLSDLFSAATDYYTHEASRGSDALKQFTSSEFGSGAIRKAEFWALVRNTDKLEQTRQRGLELLKT